MLVQVKENGKVHQYRVSAEDAERLISKYAGDGRAEIDVLDVEESETGE